MCIIMKDHNVKSKLNVLYIYIYIYIEENMNIKQKMHKYRILRNINYVL